MFMHVVCVTRFNKALAALSIITVEFGKRASLDDWELQTSTNVNEYCRQRSWTRDPTRGLTSTLNTSNAGTGMRAKFEACWYRARAEFNMSANACSECWLCLRRRQSGRSWRATARWLLVLFAVSHTRRQPFVSDEQVLALAV